MGIMRGCHCKWEFNNGESILSAEREGYFRIAGCDICMILLYRSLFLVKGANKYMPIFQFVF